EARVPVDDRQPDAGVRLLWRPRGWLVAALGQHLGRTVSGDAYGTPPSAALFTGWLRGNPGLFRLADREDQRVDDQRADDKQQEHAARLEHRGRRPLVLATKRGRPIGAVDQHREGQRYPDSCHKRSDDHLQQGRPRDDRARHRAHRVTAAVTLRRESHRAVAINARHPPIITTRGPVTPWPKIRVTPYTAAPLAAA